MDEKQQSRLPRKELRKKGHLIIPNKKKHILLILALILAGIGSSVLGYSYYNHAQQQKKERQAAAAEKEAEQQLLTTIEKQQKELGNKKVDTPDEKGTQQQLIYLPTTAQRQTFSQELEALITEAEKQLTPEKPAKIVGYVKKDTLFGKVASYSSVVDIYQQNGRAWQAAAPIQGKALYLNKDTADLPSMADLFQEQSNLSAIELIIKQRLLDEAPDKSAVIDGILNFPLLTMDQKILSYSPDTVTLALPENPLQQATMSLPLTAIQDYTDHGFIEPSLLSEETHPPLDPNKKYIALTFDDGPNPITTPRLLDILKEKNVQASFFMLGQNVVNNPDLVRRVSEEGHKVGSHSYSHPNLTELDAESIRNQVQATDRAIALATGKIPVDFRPPYGAVNKTASDIIGRPIIQWSVDSEDWKTKNTPKIIKRVMKTKHDRSIILMHDIYMETIDAVPQIIDELRNDGYEIISADELIDEVPEPGHMYYGSKSEQVIQ